MPKRENGDTIHTRSVVAKREDIRLPVRVSHPALLCPITHEMFRDPVVVIASGHTYERSAILRHFYIRDTDPCTNRVVHDKMVVQNVQTRKCVQQGWTPTRAERRQGESREVPSPGFEFKLDDGDVKTLRAIRQYCSLFDLWTDGQYPGEWQGVRVESCRVVNLDLSMKQIHSFPESIANLTTQDLDLSSNYLTRLPESIGKLTSLDVLDLRNNRLTEIPLSIGILLRWARLALTIMN